MPPSEPTPVSVRPVPAADVRALRSRVLRPGRPLAECEYPGDDLPTTVHLGAFAGEELVGIASLYREERPDEPGSPPPGRAWRLRGMATAPEARRRGLGTALLGACLGHVVAQGGGQVWCNAREPAVAFYQRAGFEVVSEPFDIAGIGVHVVMAREVEGPTARDSGTGPAVA